MYLDQFGFVTTGIGNLIDPINRVKEFHWVKIGPNGTDGPYASAQEIDDEWRRVKGKIEWIKFGAGNFIKKGRNTRPPIITLQIGLSEIDRTFLQKLTRMEQIMKNTPGGYFSDYDTFPADAQLAILTLIWAVGPNNLHIKWGNYCALCKGRKWQEIAVGNVYHWNNMLLRRDRALKNLFLNAASMEARKKAGFDCNFAQLNYPTLLFQVRDITVRKRKAID